MASSFNAQNIFGSGPHRFRVLAEGEAILMNSRLNPLQAGSIAIGPLELMVTVTGRLIAPTGTALWTLRDAVTALLTDPPTSGTLVDPHGRSWTDMSFVRFETGTQTDRGRVVSIGYTATFVRFL